MRKVYNSIGWEHLRRSLVRIKMCNRFIKFFGSIHNGRMNKVMTDFGLTDGYSVYNSLDQGKVFSSLLWHIFYNTLLCEVKKQEAVCGYRLNSHYVAKFIGSSQVATQHIFNVASEFFRMNNILINNNKTVAILINCKVVAPFLSPSLAKAHSNVRFFTNFVLRKAILDKQFSYLVSAVFYPIIGYRIQFSFISATEGKVAAVMCFANSVGVLGQLFKHKSHDLQVVSWCPVHSLCFSVCISVNLLNNFLAGVIRVFLSSGLFLGNLKCNAFHFQYGTLLSGVFGESMYFRCLFSLYHYGIAFVEQLWCHDGAQWKKLDPHGPVPVWFGAAIQHLHNFGTLDVCSSLPDSAVAKNILKSHKFRTVRDQLSSIDASGFSVYTDGSFCGLGSVNMKAGTAVFFENINLDLRIEVTGMVSSTLAELQAIALALECVPSLSSELGSGVKIVDSHLLPNVDWSRSSFVWHSDSHMAAGFTSRHSAGFCSYFIKALHYRLPVAVCKCLYDKYYPSVVCLYCDDVEVSDHVFFCAFNAAVWLQLFVDFVSA
ncbi:hypothetical protein G9A89_007406 [Geosiphon pyriformis]|nr:hypothetical protein G9A89_007406 [Geosiphon pyriformis]